MNRYNKFNEIPAEIITVLDLLSEFDWKRNNVEQTQVFLSEIYKILSHYYRLIEKEEK